MRCYDARADRWSSKTSTRPTAPSSTGRGSEAPSRWVPVTRSGSDGPCSRSSRTSELTTRSCRHPRGRIRSEPPRRHRPGLAEEHEDATQPLPSRALESGSRPALATGGGWAWSRSPGRPLGVIAYVALVDRPAENDFASRANEACAAVQLRKGVDPAGLNARRTPGRPERATPGARGDPCARAARTRRCRVGEQVPVRLRGDERIHHRLGTSDRWRQPRGRPRRRKAPRGRQGRT